MSTVNNTNNAQEPVYEYHVAEEVTLEADGTESYSRATFSSSDKLTANEAIDKAEELGDWRCDVYGGIVGEFSGRYFVECTKIATGNTEVLYDPDDKKDEEEEKEQQDAFLADFYDSEDF